MRNTQLGIYDGIRITFDECVQMTVDSINRIEGMYDTWVLMWSGGKDSTTMVTIIIQLIATGQIKPPKHLKIFISDTRMELIPLWMNAVEIISQLRDRQFDVEIVMGDIDNRFWVYMLGYGVPPPSNTFRWCTPKLKIDPSTQRLERYMAELNGTTDQTKWKKALLMTGVRIGESAARDARINISCSKDGSECGQGHYHHISKNWLDRLAPVIHWRTCIIWDWLKLFAPMKKYGGWQTAMLAEAYGDGEDINTRTGCIGCNLASKDKALLAIIKLPQWAYLKPLLKIRDLYAWMKSPEQRLRKVGYQVTKAGKGAPNQNRMGPLTFDARKEGLYRLKTIIEEVNSEARRLGRPEIDILNQEEEKRIYWHWENQSWPQGWEGTEPIATESFIQFFKDGSYQPDLFHQTHKPMIQSLEIAVKWKHYRDTHFNMYRSTSTVAAYRRNIAGYQHILKGVAAGLRLTITETLVEMLRTESDSITSLKLTCAGYDLIQGQDYTLEHPRKLSTPGTHTGAKKTPQS